MEDFIDPRDLRAILSALERLNRLGQNLLPVHRDMGEAMVNVTLRRFQTSTGPDGSRWAPNSQVTLLAHLSKFGGSYSKTGRLSKKGAERAMNKKPLIGESRALSTQIHYQASNTTLAWGSSMEYAAMMHFGGLKSEYPHLWGDIPARPIVGVSSADAHTLLDIVEHHIERAEPAVKRLG